MDKRLDKRKGKGMDQRCHFGSSFGLISGIIVSADSSLTHTFRPSTLLYQCVIELFVFFTFLMALRCSSTTAAWPMFMLSMKSRTKSANAGTP